MPVFGPDHAHPFQRHGPVWVQTSFPESYPVCFADCVDHGYTPAYCRGHCNARWSGIAGLSGFTAPAWLPVAVGVGALALFLATIFSRPT